MTTPLQSRLADSLSTLSDRGLRRLLGARTFLRGLDYEKRRVVEDVTINDINATGRVKGSDPDPYEVEISLTDEGIKATCTCPAFKKTNQHCKHVAALLINVRNQARAKLPRREPTPPAPQQPQNQQNNGESKASRRRDRRRRAQLQQLPVPPGVDLPPNLDATARPTGIGAWLAPRGATKTLNLEFRVHVRQGGLTVTVLDTDARVPLLPSVALNWQAMSPTPDRDALRVLTRFESGNPRHPAVDIRGEDAAELLPLLKGRRVLLEPALM
ncbi:MAG: SWIM zinc finger family protein, partial [Myxococcales bacterium]|nr:SWIM zinc finger family protein [Myxococcales bacterium]